MARWLVILVVLLSTALPAAAGSETMEELKDRADAAKSADRPALYIEVVERQVQACNDLYSTGKNEAALAALDDAVAYAKKARDAAIQTGKKLKHTEIHLRKIAERLRDIKRTLDFDQQAPVQAHLDRLEQFRTDLLSCMFGKKKECK